MQVFVVVVKLLVMDQSTVSNITGGTAPYTINWADGTVGATRNNLCEGSYQYYIVDAEGCENDMTVVNIECLNPPNFYSLKYYSEDCGQLSNHKYSC